MSVIEAAGLTRDEAVGFAGEGWHLYQYTAPGNIALKKLAVAVAAELKALPLEPGDVVRIPFAPADTFEVRCVEDDEAWVLDVKSGGRLTVKLDCIERVQP